MSSEPITVLHLVGGLEFRGGAASVVEKLALAGVPGVNHCIWMHSDFKPSTGELLFITQGRARNMNTGLWHDLLAVPQDFGPIFRWARRRHRLVLHAHSRAGIIAASLVRWLARKPLVIHLHFLASRPWLYRGLRRLFDAEIIYNSRKTCLHYGDNPVTARILMPPINWPAKPPALRHGSARFVAAGNFVRGKHLHLLVTAFLRLRAEGVKAELLIFGRSATPLDPICQREIIKASGEGTAIQLKDWTPDWTRQLKGDDVFVHLGEPESFGIVILEAFAVGCKLLVLPKTFVDELPEPIRSQGIYRLERLELEHLTEKMKEAIRTIDSNQNSWEARRAASGLFSIKNSVPWLGQLYESLSHN